jgi:FkbM family methyltransferase
MQTNPKRVNCRWDFGAPKLKRGGGRYEIRSLSPFRKLLCLLHVSIHGGLMPLASNMRNSIRYMWKCAKLCVGKEVLVSGKLALDHVVLGSEYCRWPVLPAMTSSRSVLYSFGVGEDITFDLAAIDRFHCHVYAFDPTPRSIKWIRNQRTPPEFHFFDFGVGAKPGEVIFHPPKCDSHTSYTVSDRTQFEGQPVKAAVLDLPTIMERLNHKNIDILKMDVEGAEYAVIEGLGRLDHRPGQLMVEFHHGMYGYSPKDTKRALDTLRRCGYHPHYVSETWREVGFVHRDAVAEDCLVRVAS